MSASAAALRVRCERLEAQAVEAQERIESRTLNPNPDEP
jgi:hypothetical protein